MPVLALKLLTVPLLILLVSLAGQRFGPRLAGVLTGLPVIAGPIAWLLGLEHGVEFAARASLGTLAGELSLGVFCIVYAHSARAPWWLATLAGWAGFAACTLLLRYLEVDLLGALLLACATPWLILALTPAELHSAPLKPATRAQLLGRMLAGVALVLVLTSVAPWFGPRLSGLLTIFPVATSVLAIALHRAHGRASAVQLLRGLAMGLYSVTSFFGVLALALRALGISLAFALAVLAALLTQALSVRAARRSKAALSP